MGWQIFTNHSDTAILKPTLVSASISDIAAPENPDSANK
jgi:hypothetical protein